MELPGWLPTAGVFLAGLTAVAIVDRGVQRRHSKAVVRRDRAFERLDAARARRDAALIEREE